MIDNKGRLFGKINVVDFIIVLVIIVALCATVFKFSFSPFGGIKNLIATPPIRVEYVLKISGVRDFTAKNVVRGDRLYNEDDNTYIGVITDVEIENATEYVAKVDGTVAMTENPNRYDVYVTVECDAYTKRGTYHVVPEDKKDGMEICEYMYVKACTSRFSSMAQIFDVRQK